MPYRKPAATPELDFDSLWNYAGEWFEAPNRHRQGWSGVNRILCRDADGKGPFYAFLKRQHNFMRRTWRHPWHGVSTFYCEYQNLLHLSRRGVPVPAPLFFSEKKEGNDVNAVLLTAELVGFSPLDRFAAGIFNVNASIAKQRKLVASVAHTVTKLHTARFQHRALYPKHIFVKETPSGNFESMLIDLEKARIKLLPVLRTLQDLATLNRDLMHLSRTTRLYFLKQYYGVDKLNTPMKWIARQIQARSERKKKS
ncbi:lipopolysaccharide kinase InaA family protein [Methylobacillus sp. Pita2]|uniref:lipopolysaccharide kinase InaA family protein n=1 Tax=Methylobacillus sp. Pita2 TaxID=3383245 RepID=UPI0038B6668E